MNVGLHNSYFKDHLSIKIFVSVLCSMVAHDAKGCFHSIESLSLTYQNYYTLHLEEIEKHMHGGPSEVVIISVLN